MGETLGQLNVGEQSMLRRSAISGETQTIVDKLRGSHSVSAARGNPLDDTVRFFDELIPFRRTTFKSPSEGFELAENIYTCRANNHVLGIQAVLASTTAEAELPYFMNICNIARNAGLQPDLHLWYADWLDFPLTHQTNPNEDFRRIKERVEKLGLNVNKLHNVSTNSPEGIQFQNYISGQSSELEKARFPGHPLTKSLKKWANHYARQRSNRYANLSAKERGLRSPTSEFKMQVIADASYRRAFCITAADLERKQIGNGAWGYSLFVTTEKSPVELAQYNAAAPFIRSPDVKKDMKKLPIVNLDVGVNLNS